MPSAEFSAAVLVHDEAVIRSYADTVMNGGGEGDFPDVLLRVVVNPERVPLETGYEIMEQSAEPGGDGMFLIRVQADVFGAEAFVAEARRCYARAWRDRVWVPASMSEALYEIATGSGASPSPLELGYEILGTRLGESACPDAVQPAPD